jgi:hypothetical protein
MLCLSALRSFEKYGTRLDAATNAQVQRGVLVNYDSLPGYVPQVLLPLFGVAPLPGSWLRQISEESKSYSKSGKPKKAGGFTGDSADKDGRATEAIQEYATKIMGPTFELMEQKSLQALNSIDPQFIQKISAKKGVPVDKFDWSLIKALPDTVEGLVV